MANAPYQRMKVANQTSAKYYQEGIRKIYVESSRGEKPCWTLRDG